jgi:CopG family nickel-responsive transcriptional regulator
LSELVRFGIAVEGGLLAAFDRQIQGKGYANRSEAIRDLIRDALVRELARKGKHEMVGTITLVYSHETRELSDRLNHLQHDCHKSIVCANHVHLDAHNCLEVLIVRGKADSIQAIADRLIGVKGVKHGKLVLTSTGKELT